MATSGITSTTRREADLPTFSSEEQARTFDKPSANPVANVPAPPQAGDVLKNRFVLYECLSKGSTSRLFRALDQRRAEKNAPEPVVTLKIVTAMAGTEPPPVQALRREAAIASGLDHPNLLAIHGLDRDGPHTFLCMEWRDGESLGVILDARGARPMTRVQALRILEGVCQALSYLHARQITHSDIKPGNILVTADGEATLIDFGVASGPGADDLPQVHGHTPEYASPEVLRGANATPVDDLFSVACVAYRMLSGQRPFGTGTAADAAAAGTRPACPAHLSPAQWRALDRALAYDRTDRQPDVETFINQLKATRDDTVTQAELPETIPWPLDSDNTGSTDSGEYSQRLLRYWPAIAGLALLLAGAVLLLNRPSTPAAASKAVVAAAPQSVGEPEVTAGISLPSDLQSGTTTRPVATSAPVVAADSAIKPGPSPPLPESRPEPVPKPVPTTDSRRPSAPPVAESAPPVRESPPPVVADVPVWVPDPPGPASPATRSLTSKLLSAEPPAPPVNAVTPAGASTAVTANIVPFSSLGIRRFSQPRYPRVALARQVSGAVHVSFAVDRSGMPQDPRIVSSEPDDVFDEAALDAVKRWRFDPPRVNGVRQKVQTEIRLVFKPTE